MMSSITAGWLLMVLVIGQGGSSINTLGAFATEAGCSQAKEAINELQKAVNASSFVTGITGSASFSKCVVIGNPTEVLRLDPATK